MIARCPVHKIVLHIKEQVDCEYIEVDPCPTCQHDAYEDGISDGIGIGKIELINQMQKTVEERRD